MIDHDNDPLNVRCDRCDRDCRATDEHPEFNPEFANPLTAHFQIDGCYGSVRYDLQTLVADLCEDCATDVAAFIDSGRPDAPGGPARGRGMTVVDEGPEQHLAYCREQGIPTVFDDGEGGRWEGIDAQLVDPGALRRWYERRHRVRLFFWR